MNKQNKALVITELGKKALLQETAYPEINKDEVVIRTQYSGVSIGTEMWIASGERSDYGPVPFVNGYQAAGEICEIGSEVEGFSIGDIVTVFCRGAHAQFTKAIQSRVHTVTNRASLMAAALFVQPSTAANALNMACINTGDVVYIAGQGLIGQATAALAKLRGAYVITSDISPQRLEISEKHCADWVINAAEEKSVSGIIKSKFPNGVDVVIESTGFASLLDDALLCCKKFGRFVFEGWYPGAVNYNFTTPHKNQITAFYPCFIGEKPVREGVIRLIESKKLDMQPLISDIVSWKDSEEIYNNLFTEKRNQYNGIVIDWTKK